MKKERMLLVTLLVIFTFSIISYTSVCYASGSGTTGVAFLKIGAGARATGMGEAFVGVADDVNAIYWNPAGLAKIRKKEVNFMYSPYFVSSQINDIYYTYLAYAHPLESIGTIGANFIFGSYGKFIGRDDSGDLTDDFTCSDLLFTLSYGEEIKSIGLEVGANLKIISETLADKSSTGVGFDFGALYRPKKISQLSIGLTIQNLGTPLTFISEPTPLPISIKLGAGYKMSINPLNSILISSDLLFPFDNIVGFRAGAEYTYNGMFSARLGYKVDSALNINPLAGLTAGVGFKWDKYCVDFSFVPYGNMGNTYRLSLGATF